MHWGFSGRKNDPPDIPNVEELLASTRLLGEEPSAWRTRTIEIRSALLQLATSGPLGRDRLRQLFLGASPRQWIAIDSIVRGSFYAAASRADDAPSGSDTISRGIASMNHNGYRREQAIAGLARDPDPLAAGFLALRTVDWVVPVAERARIGLAGVMKREEQAVVVAAPILIALSGRSRIEQALADLHGILQSSTSLQRRLLASVDPQTRRFALRLLLASGTGSAEELAAIALRDPDTIVSREAGIAVSSSVGEVSSQTVAGLLVAGRAVVRRAVLDALQQPPPDLVTVALGRLFDSSPLVRAGAQAFARRIGQPPENVYRDAYQTGDREVIALRELGEIGLAEDRSIVVAALSSDDPSQRRAAVEASWWLSPDQAIERLVPLLSDSANGVIRAAERRLEAHARQVDADVLDRLGRSERPEVRRAAFRLKRHQGDTPRLHANLLALADGDDATREAGLRDLRGWLQTRASVARRADQPTRRALAALADAAESQIEPGVMVAVRFHAGLRPQDLR